MPYPEPERRVALGELRVEQADNDFRPVIRGYAIVFNSLSENLGGFREIIPPQAVERTVRENMDVRALVDHDPAKILGRTRAGTLRLAADKVGLRAEIDPPNTTAARDTVESVRRGDVSGMSFGFRAIGEDDSWWSLQDGVPVRTVKDMAIHDVSVVTYPAYVATQVEVALRALESFRRSIAVYRPSLKLLEQMHRQRLIDAGVPCAPPIPPMRN